MQFGFLEAFVVTVIAEGFIYLYFLRNVKKSFVFSIIIQAITLPFLWFVVAEFLPAEYSMLIGEMVVFAIEVFLIKMLLKFDYLKSALISAIANLTSYSIGIFLFII